jgi:hypothetical protein
MSQKVGMSLVFDAKRVQAAFKMMRGEVRARMQQQVKESTERVESGAKARVPVSGPASRKAKNRLGPGELRNTIRSELSPEGLTGFVKAGFGQGHRKSRVSRPMGRNQRVLNATQFMRAQHAEALRMNAAMDRTAGRHAMNVEYGVPSRGQPAQPFLRPAKEAELPALRKGVGDALRGAVDASRQPAPAIA